MRSALAIFGLAALAAASPMPQGVTSAISPSSSAPAGCLDSRSGTFEIQVVNVTKSSKRDLEKRQDTALELTLSGGILHDAKGRTGYIAANSQFQFDGPPQTGAIYTAGWSVCSNGSLALGGDAIFYQCLSGTFYNLYDESTGAQCSPVYIVAMGGTSAGSTTAVASQIPDGQPTASPVSSAVCEFTDGQPQITGCVSQISDGQVQATTGAAVSQISDGQPQATTGAAVTQISDGQPQASTGGAVSQISDGQVQATTAAAVSQISDGQVQATTAAAVSQISDGQVQATTGAPVTQISDGQVQATTGAAVSQISDGQVQATTGANGTVASPSATIQPYTGAAPTAGLGGQALALAAGVLAVAML